MKRLLAWVIVLIAPAAALAQAPDPALDRAAARIADAAQGHGFVHRLDPLGILPQRLGEIGLHQSGRDAVDADVVASPLLRIVPRQRHVGGL